MEKNVPSHSGMKVRMQIKFRSQQAAQCMQPLVLQISILIAALHSDKDTFPLVLMGNNTTKFGRVKLNAVTQLHQVLQTRSRGDQHPPTR